MFVTSAYALPLMDIKLVQILEQANVFPCPLTQFVKIKGIPSILIDPLTSYTMDNDTFTSTIELDTATHYQRMRFDARNQKWVAFYNSPDDDDVERVFVYSQNSLDIGVTGHTEDIHYSFDEHGRVTEWKNFVEHPLFEYEGLNRFPSAVRYGQDVVRFGLHEGYPFSEVHFCKDKADECYKHHVTVDKGRLMEVVADDGSVLLDLTKFWGDRKDG